ncbi:MAG: hypothetical protein PUP91_14425 [Rhizonema sp. PD37]|nr:hypothetical protein [Rhizonema sp. PD37]
MLKFWLKRIVVAFSFSTAMMTVCQSASAQLNVGRYGIQPGLESEYLQYQLSGRNVSQIRGISSCSIGFGLSCDKTGAVLQQLVESNNGANYHNLLIQAAGGNTNFNNFASFYGNNPNLSSVPYASFWQQDSPSIVDGYRYLLGNSLSSTPVEGVGLVTKNFYWSPLSGGNNSLSLRNGLLDLKYSYGRLLLEEAAKIPNIQQQIQSLGLAPDVTKYYLNNLSNGLQALNGSNEAQLKDSILKLLSFPYSPNGGEYGRPNLGIPKDFDHIVGAPLPGDSFAGTSPVLLEPDAIALDGPSIPAGDVFVQPASGGGFPTGWLLGGGALALLLFLLLNGGGSSRNGGSSSQPGGVIGGTGGGIGGGTGGGTGGTGGTGGGTNICDTGNGSSGPGHFMGVPCDTSGHTIVVRTVPEPSVVQALLLLIVLMCMLTHKHRRSQTIG